jgi:hypothetical protein
VTTIDDIVKYLAEHGLAGREDLVPCTLEEIEEIRTAQELDRLPPQYESFLRIMGRKAGSLLRGTSIFYPSMVKYLDEMREFPEENEFADLVVPGSVLLGMHQGYVLYWLEPGDLSGATHAREELPDPDAQRWPTFFDFLRHEAEAVVKMRAGRKTDAVVSRVRAPRAGRR